MRKAQNGDHFFAFKSVLRGVAGAQLPLEGPAALSIDVISWVQCRGGEAMRRNKAAYRIPAINVNDEQSPLKKERFSFCMISFENRGFCTSGGM